MRPSLDRISLLQSQVSALEQKVMQLRARIRELNGGVIEREGLWGGLLAVADAALELRHKQADRLHRELIERQKIIDAMLSSRSWRISLPVRLAGRAARKINRLLWNKRPADGAAAKPADGSEGARALAAGSEILEQPSSDMLARTRSIRYVHRVTDRVDANKLDIKAIAFYLPRLQSVRKTDQRSDDSVTQWSRVVNASPRYFGQYQPRLPDDLGFYVPSQPEVMRTQIELARQYGIYGLCFYHHWSGGKHEPERSLRHFLADAGLDIKFCLCWETENSPTDNESERRIPTSQDPSTDGVSLLELLVAVFSDPRYIRIDGKPLLIVSRPSRFRDAAACAQQWRAYAKQLGLAGLYLVAAGARDAVDPRSLEFDALLEILPLLDLADVTIEHTLTDPNYAGRIYSYPEIVDKWNNLADPPFVTFNTVIPGWDDEATRPGAGDSVAGSSPSLYAKWLKQSCQRTMMRRPEERLIFINAWNGWAEGAYLEPDRKFGYAYLHATANVLRCYHNDPEARKLIEDLNVGFSRTNDAAIILHCHYEDLIVPIFDRYISQIKDADLFVTVRNDISKTAIEEIHRRFPNVSFLCQENRGRDIRPFLLALRQVESLGYTIACKVHTKKTPHRERDTGELWREELMGPLLGSAECVARAAQIFSQEADVGLLAPAGSVMDLRIHHVHAPNAFWLDRLLYRLGRSDLVGKYTFDFPAGSMYWFRVSALAGFADFILAEDEFEQELGQVDGTLGHSVERLVGLYAQGLGYRMKEVERLAADLAEASL